MAKAGAIHAAHEPARRSRRAMIFRGKVMRKSAAGRLSVQPGRECEHGWHHGRKILPHGFPMTGEESLSCSTAKKASAGWGYDVISQITACNTPGSQKENMPGSREEIRQRRTLVSEKNRIRCMKVQIE